MFCSFFCIFIFKKSKLFRDFLGGSVPGHSDRNLFQFHLLEFSPFFFAEEGLQCRSLDQSLKSLAEELLGQWSGWWWNSSIGGCPQPTHPPRMEIHVQTQFPKQTEDNFEPSPLISLVVGKPGENISTSAQQVTCCEELE